MPGSRFFLLAALLALILALLAAAATATPLTYQEVFVTSFTTAISTNTAVPPPFPGWGGIDAADWACTFAAYNAGRVPSWDGISPFWKAILSTNTVDSLADWEINYGESLTKRTTSATNAATGAPGDYISDMEEAVNRA